MDLDLDSLQVSLKDGAVRFQASSFGPRVSSALADVRG